MKNNTIVQSTATVATALDVGKAVVRNMAGSGLDGSRMSNIDSSFRTHLSNALKKKEVTK